MKRGGPETGDSMKQAMEERDIIVETMGRGRPGVRVIVSYTSATLITGFSENTWRAMASIGQELGITPLENDVCFETRLAAGTRRDLYDFLYGFLEEGGMDVEDLPSRLADAAAVWVRPTEKKVLAGKTKFEPEESQESELHRRLWFLYWSLGGSKSTLSSPANVFEKRFR